MKKTKLHLHSWHVVLASSQAQQLTGGSGGSGSGSGSDANPDADNPPPPDK